MYNFGASSAGVLYNLRSYVCKATPCQLYSVCVCLSSVQNCVDCIIHLGKCGRMHCLTNFKDCMYMYVCYIQCMSTYLHTRAVLLTHVEKCSLSYNGNSIGIACRLFWAPTRTSRLDFWTLQFVKQTDFDIVFCFSCMFDYIIMYTQTVKRKLVYDILKHTHTHTSTVNSYPTEWTRDLGAQVVTETSIGEQQNVLWD